MGALTKSQILIVDDVPAFCEEVAAPLRSAGFAPRICFNPSDAAELTRQSSFDLIITSLVMREMSGFDLIRTLRGIAVTTPILMITGQGSPRAAIEAVRLGASDYLAKPVSSEELIARVQALLNGSSETQQHGMRLNEIVTQDRAMQGIFEMVETIAPTRSRVLILGETGTGKQLLARAIHAYSGRAKQPFVEVNCAAIPDSLLESELFGHEKGAFTGATSRRIGRFEQAGDGTIFLDEIGEMNAGLQSKLLHVIEGGQYTRVGGSKLRVSGARVVAATNRNLSEEVDAGRFRADLYFRLNVITIAVPSLRERVDDIPLLAQHFLERFCESGDQVKRFDAEAISAMKQYAWPGNVRELQNLAERLSILHPTDEIGVAALSAIVRDVPGGVVPSASLMGSTYREAKAEFERAYLSQMIEATNGNLAEAARRAGLDRAQFYRMAQRHALTGQPKREGSPD